MYRKRKKKNLFLFSFFAFFLKSATLNNTVPCTVARFKHVLYATLILFTCDCVGATFVGIDTGAGAVAVTIVAKS